MRLMPKSKPSQSEQTKRNPRDPGPDREKSWRPTDENFDESDGTVDAENEFDTEKYERAERGKPRH